MAAPGSISDLRVRELVALPDDAARERYLALHRGLATSELVTELTGRVHKEVRVDADGALRLADVAISVARTLASHDPLAEAFRSKANALYILGRHSEAVEHHQRAAGLFESSGNREQLARTLSGSMQPWLLQGKYDEALAAAERARGIFIQLGNRLRVARVDINLGNVFYRQDRFDEALECYERAYEELLHHHDAEGMAAVLSNLAVCYITLNRFAKALEVYENARRHCEKEGMPLLVAQADYNIAYLYFLRGEYGRAIEMLRAARASAKKLSDGYHVALCNLDLSELYIELNLGAEAGELARDAHAAFEQLGMGYEAAKALAFAAIAASQQGQSFEGLKLFAEAKERFVREKNLVWPSLIDLYQALVLYNEGRLFEAKRLCAAAEEFFRDSTLPRKAILAELLSGRIAFRMGDVEGAMQRCRATLDRLQTLDAPVLRYQAELMAGQLELARGRHADAFERFKGARTDLETLRGNLRGEELKIAFFRNKLEVYERLVELCMTGQGSFAEAYAFIEQAKSRALLDLLVQPLHTPAPDDAGQSELVRSIRNLREELNWYYNLIEREQLRPEERSQERIEMLERQARARETDLMRSLQEATLAEAAEAGLRAASHVPLEEVRAALPADAAIVEYFLVQDRFVACVITHNDLQLVPVTLQSRVANAMRLLQFQLSKFRLDPQYVETFSDALLQSTQAHLKSLYAELIEPVAPFVSGAEHLILVPHGLLHYIPFHALYDGTNYLADRVTVSYAPSASVYAVCRQKPAAETGGDFLVMGVDDALAPSIRDEATTVAAMFDGTKLFLGAAASEDVLRAHAPHCRMVHIATHGYFRQDNPMFSSIRLGGSYLSLYDLYHLRLPTDLVVLSGCATGLNSVTPGDELIGLSRGLLHAGAQSVVLSLWDVHDKSTAEFMTAFYAGLRDGKSKAESLRSAMITLRERYPHPYHWAPFVLVGRP